MQEHFVWGCNKLSALNSFDSYLGVIKMRQTKINQFDLKPIFSLCKLFQQIMHSLIQLNGNTLLTKNIGLNVSFMKILPDGKE